MSAGETCTATYDQPVPYLSHPLGMHRCELDEHHDGHHACADCPSSWERGPWDDDEPQQGPERPRFSSQAGLATFRPGCDWIVTPK